MHLTFAEINLKALKHNFLSLKKKLINPKTKIMAVVKADAYGHGVFEVVNSLLSLTNPPDYFGVALINEALEIYNNKNNSKNILVFEPPNSFSAKYYIKYNNIIPTVFTEYHLQLLEKHNLSKKNKIKVHIKIDTGMGRLGAYFKNAIEFIKSVNNNSNFEIDGIYTHFASSDSSNLDFTKTQIKRFNEIIKALKELNIKYNIAHAANSGAIIQVPEAQFDMIRPGISLYGYAPSFHLEKKINLKPVMSIYSYVASLRKFEEGEFVGYGSLYKTKKNENIFTVPFGYADGISRSLTDKFSVICNDEFYKQVGRINMDRFMVSAKKDNIKIESKVILIGNSKNKKITAWDWSKPLNTIPYEITCGISKRVPRIYIK